MKIPEQRMTRALNFSVEMLRNKFFGKHDSDLEFQFTYLSMLPLYSKTFDANAALQQCLDTIYMPSLTVCVIAL